MARDILLLHDFNPYVFYILPYLQQCLGNQFIIIQQGDIALPLTNAELQPLLLLDPKTRVCLAAGAQPIGRELRRLNTQSGLQVRSIIPIAHPMTRVVRLFQQRVAFDALADGDMPAEPDLSWYVARGLAVALNSIPAANYQVAHLLGGLWGAAIDTETAADLASFVCDCTSPTLADFPAIARAQVFAALLEAGMPAAAESFVAADASTNLPTQIQMLRDSLPAALFEELRYRNEGDLLLFHRVAECVIERAPLSAAERAKAHETIALADQLIVRGRYGRPRQSGLDTTAGGFVDADPVLGWRPTPNAHFALSVHGRDLVMETDASGLRPVIGQNPIGTPTLAVYGCSCTFGWSVATDGVFCSLLQAMFPQWRVENHGVIGYGPLHNLLQLERNQRFDPAEFVTFCQIPGHSLRAAADFAIIAAYQQHPMLASKVRTYPKAYLDQSGKLRVRQIAFRRPELLGIDHTDFAPDEHYLDLLCFRIYERAADIVRANRGYFFLTLLNETPSAYMLDLLMQAQIPVVNAGLVGDEYTNLPDDGHPNALAHRHFAERIRDHLVAIAPAQANATRLQAS